MHTQTPRQTGVSCAILAALLTAVPAITDANQPHTVITGHHDHKKGVGLEISSGMFAVQDGYARIITTAPSNTTFNGNIGYGLCVDPKASVTIRGGQFNENSKVGMYLESGQAIVDNGQFDHNRVGLDAHDNAAVTVKDGTFDHNEVGMLLKASVATIDGGQFSHNSGMGLAAMGDALNQPSTVSIRGGQFTDNQQGLLAAHATIDITGGTFSGNTDTDLCALEDGTITLHGTFRQNGVLFSGTVSTNADASFKAGSFDVLFPGSATWQTLKYEVIGGKLALIPVMHSEASGKHHTLAVTKVTAAPPGAAYNGKCPEKSIAARSFSKGDIKL